MGILLIVVCKVCVCTRVHVEAVWCLFCFIAILPRRGLPMNLELADSGCLALCLALGLTPVFPCLLFPTIKITGRLPRCLAFYMGAGDLTLAFASGAMFSEPSPYSVV